MIFSYSDVCSLLACSHVRLQMHLCVHPQSVLPLLDWEYWLTGFAPQNATILPPNSKNRTDHGTFLKVHVFRSGHIADTKLELLLFLQIVNGIEVVR